MSKVLYLRCLFALCFVAAATESCPGPLHNPTVRQVTGNKPLIHMGRYGLCAFPTGNYAGSYAMVSPVQAFGNTAGAVVMRCGLAAIAGCAGNGLIEQTGSAFSGSISYFCAGVFLMRLLLAIFLPFAAFFTIGRPISGIVCLILQITLIGWLPAAIWAVYALSQYTTDRKIEKMKDQMGRPGG